VRERVETVIVGSGQAGLAMSYHLGRLGREHLVLERGRIAERWRSERWDSLVFQSPSWIMRLPGYRYEGATPDAFMPRDGVVRFIEDYARLISPPIRCGIRVTSLERAESGRLLVETEVFTVEADNVVVATGPFQSPAVPSFCTELGRSLYQVTANRYRNPGELPSGAVLVVGCGGSGYQIAEELVQAGRRVYLSVGGHQRVPRRYRGRDFAWWHETTGASDRVVEGAAARARAPLLTGTEGGHDANPRELASRGAFLLGRLQDICGGRLRFVNELEKSLARGDDAYDIFTRAVDEYIEKHGLTVAAPPERDRRHAAVPNIAELDARHAGITSVIWALGYRYDFGWIRCPVLDPEGRPVHRRGVSEVPGVLFLGLHRLHKLKSAFLWGVGDDAAYLAEHIVHRASRTMTSGEPMRP